MTLKYIFLILFTLVISTLAIAAEPDSLIIGPETWVQIDSIEIRGNEQTEDFVILRELTFDIGDKVNGKIIEFNRERVYSLGLFNFVKIFAESDSSLTKVIIDVEETWYIYPVPFLNIRDKDLDRASYGISLLYKNFRGRNETIQAVASFGYDQFYLLSYYNPLIVESANLNLSTAVLYQTPLNKSIAADIINGESFDYTMAGGLVTLGKRLSQFHEIFATIGYNYVEAPNNILSGIMASGTRIDRSLMLGGAYVYDSRDLKQFASNGVFAKVEYIHKGIGHNKIDYNIFGIDFREYRRIFDDLTAKWRIGYSHTFGRLVPRYDYAILGNAQYIRGHFDDRREGQNLIITSVETAVPIIKEWDVSLDLPLIPKSLSSTRIGLHINLFYDAGVTYNNNESLSLHNFDSGWGAGLTILFLPFNAVRFEYAFDELGNGEFLFGTGFSF